VPGSAFFRVFGGLFLGRRRLFGRRLFSRGLSSLGFSGSFLFTAGLSASVGFRVRGGFLFAGGLSAILGAGFGLSLSGRLSGRLCG